MGRPMPRIPTQATLSARAATALDTLNRLHDKYQAMYPTHGCVFGEGGIPASVMVVGGLPSAQALLNPHNVYDEQRTGIEKLMISAGLYTHETTIWIGDVQHTMHVPNTYITYTVKHKPPITRRGYTVNARHVKTEHIELPGVQPLLQAEWYLIGMPKIIIVLDGPTYRLFTGSRNTHFIANSGRPVTTRIFGKHEVTVWPLISRFILPYAQLNKHDQETGMRFMEQQWTALDDWIERNPKAMIPYDASGKRALFMRYDLQ